MIKKVILLLVVALFFYTCKQDKNKAITENEIKNMITLGNSISAETQSVLLKNVAEAIKKGGTDYAVDFCNVNVFMLTDSVANKHTLTIQRLSNKNRNPNNVLQTHRDSLAWEKINTDKSTFIEQYENGEIYFYKPISIKMPTCIKCHGNQTDISESTKKIIAKRYPNDKATGYKMGDLRGMWKIKLEKNK
ncbi:MAG: DUF3365 domain-containing protein [Aestuariibaculum sp.]